LTEWLRNFCGLSNRAIAEDAVQALLTSYNAAFGGIPDSVFIRACETYVKDGKYFPPRPAELAELIPRTTERAQTQEGDYRIRQGVQCSRCRKIAQCIQEPAFGGTLLCRECYTGMTPQQFKRNMAALSRINAIKGVSGIYDSKKKMVVLGDGTVKAITEGSIDLFGGNENGN